MASWLGREDYKQKDNQTICYEQRARRGDGAIDVFDEDEKFISGG